jgi:hypothetical protein
MNPRVALDPSGNVIVVWQDNRYGNFEILWQKFGPLGTPLSSPVRVTNTVASSVNPDVACDPLGISHVVWQEGPSSGFGDVYFCRLNAGGVKVLPDASPNNIAGIPRISATAAGETDLVYDRNAASDHFVYYRRYNAAGALSCTKTLALNQLWPAEKRAVVGTSQLTGNVSIFWWDADQFSTQKVGRGRVTSPCGATSTTQLFAQTSQPAVSCDVVGSSEWMVFERGGDIHRYYDGGPYCKISQGIGTSTRPSVGADAGTQYVTWQDTRDGPNGEIYFGRFSGCTNLSGDQRLTVDPATSSSPDISVDKSGNGHWVVVWSDTRDGNAEIYMTSGDQPFVTAPAQIVVAEGDSVQFSVVAGDPDGEAIASLTVAGLPGGATFVPAPDNSSGQFTWSPTAQNFGEHVVTFTAANGLSGSASTTIDVRAKYEILSQNLDRSTYVLGQSATLTVSIRNNTSSGAPLTVEAAELQGPLSSPVEFPVGSQPVTVGTHATATLQFPFTIEGVQVDGISPFHIRMRVLDQLSGVQAERTDLAFQTTSATVAEIQQAVAQIDQCGQQNPVGDTFSQVFPCVRAWAGDLGVPGMIFGVVLAYDGIVKNLCRASQYAAQGDVCKRDVSYTLAAMSAISMGSSVAALLGSGGALATIGSMISPLRCVLNLVSQGDVASWFCNTIGAGPLGASGMQTDIPIGQGVRARGLLTQAGEVCDSIGLPFYAHVAIEGPAAVRISLPAGWVSADSASIDDALGWTMAPDTLQWFTIGTRVSPLSAGYDTTLATLDALKPMRIELTATAPGPVFLGVIRRPLGGQTADTIFYDPITVQASTRMVASIGGGNPMFIDWDGDGSWDQIRYPPATILTGVEEGGSGGEPSMSLRVFPTPARARVGFRYTVAHRGMIALRLYDTSGRLVRTLEEAVVESGLHDGTWDGTDSQGRRVANGIYLIRLSTAEGAIKRKVALLR